MCREASGSERSSLHSSLSCRGDKHITRSELQLWGTDPDAFLTYSDREQMGRYSLGQQHQCWSPPDPHALNDNFYLVKVLLICPGASGSATQETEPHLPRFPSEESTDFNSIDGIVRRSTNNWQNIIQMFEKITNFDALSWYSIQTAVTENTHEFLWFIQHITTSCLERLDAVLTINKVKQTSLYMFSITANNDVYYFHYLTALRP